MPIVFACAASHAPGITAWADAASEQEAQAVRGGFTELHQAFEAANPETVLLLTSEHWANFFSNTFDIVLGLEGERQFV